MENEGIIWGDENNLNKTENQFLRNIQGKTLKELEEFYNKNSINFEELNDFKYILIYLIEENAPVEYIKFIIKKQKNKENVMPLLNALKYNNFKVANILLKNNANINGVIKDSKNEYYITEYLLNNRELNFEIIKYLIEIQCDVKLFTPNFLCNLIKSNNLKFLELIFHSTFYNKGFIENVILNKFLIQSYKNKKPFSNKQIEMLTKSETIDINKKTKSMEFPLIYITSLRNNNIITFLLLFIEYADRNGIILNINDKNYYKCSPLLKAIEENYCSRDVVNILINYADIHKILLDINNKDINGYSCLHRAVENDDIEVVELLIDYANRHGILFNIMERNKNGNFPLFDAIPPTFDFYSVEYNENNMFKLLIDYANDHKIVWNVNEKNERKQSLLLKATSSSNHYFIISLLIEYANKHNQILDLNCKDEDYNYPLLNLCNCTNIESDSEKTIADSVNLLLSYANKHNIILDITGTNIDGNYPLLSAIKYNNLEIMKKLIAYAKKHNIILDIISKNANGDFPLLASISRFIDNKKDGNFIDLLIDIAINQKIVLNINEKNKSGNFPLLNAMCSYYSFDLLNLLINYADHYNILLNFNDKDNSDSYPLLEIIRYHNFNVINNLSFWDGDYMQCNYNNIDTLNLFFDYANRHNIILNINDKDKNGSYPLKEALNKSNDSPVITKKLIEYANMNGIILNINESHIRENSPLHIAIKNSTSTIELVDIILTYADQHNIILNCSNKNIEGNTPLLQAIQCKSNIALNIIKRLMEYCDRHNIILDLNNEKNNEGYSIMMVNDIRINELLFQYASNHNINLEFRKKR